MRKCAEATPVELMQAYVFDTNHCSPEELAEMGKWSEKKTGELTQADLCKLKPSSSPENPTTLIVDILFNPKPNPRKESVAQVLAAGSSKIPPQKYKDSGNIFRICFWMAEF
jgi:hypothetical protein